MLATKHEPLAAVQQSVEMFEKPTELLTRLFARFQESSEKLEVRYTELTNEVEDLKRQLLSKEEEIKRSERLAMLGETAAALAHEVRNPLGAITLFLSMLRNDISDRAPSLTLVDEIERSVTSLNNVVSNVLHFAKNNKPTLAPINLHSILGELAQHFESLYAPNVQVKVSKFNDPFIRGDDQALRQCFYNLIMNALQAMSFKGLVSVSCHSSSDKALVLSVEDSGPGIPAEILPRLFEPFVTGRQQGTGLGLSIVQRIIHAHGGEISVKNNPGAVFEIVLPRQATIAS